MDTKAMEEIEVYSAKIEEYAAALFKAKRNGKSIECFADREVHFTSEEGYLIQDLVIEKSLLNSEELKGYKIGLTTKETQRMYNTEKPFYGTLTSSNIISSEVFQLDDLFAPFVIEMELMFILKEDLPFMATEQDILKNTLIAPGLEIPDGRYVNWTKNMDLPSIIADVGAAGRVVVGEPVSYSSISDLLKMKAILYWEGEKLEEGYGEVVLGNPINTMVWLSKELSMQGKTLKKGMIVSSGTMIMPKPVKRGKYLADFHGIGSVSVVVE